MNLLHAHVILSVDTGTCICTRGQSTDLDWFLNLHKTASILCQVINQLLPFDKWLCNHLHYLLRKQIYKTES